MMTGLKDAVHQQSDYGFVERRVLLLRISVWAAAQLLFWGLTGPVVTTDPAMMLGLASALDLRLPPLRNP